MKVSVIGTGYVGLVTGVCLAEKGHDVVCVDIDASKVDRITRGIPPIFEAGLEELLRKNIGRSLRATTDLAGAVRESSITLVAVGTPFDGRVIDLTYVREVSRQVGEALARKPEYHTVVVKSTVVPGTTDQVVVPILEKSSGKKAGRDFGVGMNPEFLTEGQAIKDFMEPDRIVIGGIDQRSIDVLSELYRPFTNVEVLRTNTRTAEMIKYASNAMLATQISFANEIANLSSAIGGIDSVEVMKGVHLSAYLRSAAPDGTRVQAPLSSFLEAGCGFGGSCLPKDVKALVAHGEAASTPMRLLDAVLAVNAGQPQRMIALLRKHYPTLHGRRITVLGLAFKPDTDDMRESPAIPIVRGLLAEGAIVRAYDPIATDEARKVFRDSPVEYLRTLEEAVQNTDALLLVTRWGEFQKVPALLEKLAAPPLVVDGRRALDKTRIKRYEGIGL